MAEKTTLLPILNRTPAADFHGTLRQHGLGELRRREVTTLQINVGKLCNQACHHCHVEAGPKRTEIMPTSVAERIMT
ncbi:MAG TPA: radical SAM protein, partial [Candidatus Angelobacter sp.]|nr:radical SAM protein [Candidatus Angelobacter sp.]